MNQFRFADGRDQGFDEREQEEIIALAAALQRQQGQRATLSDLERAAIEAGIEPRFVREAVRQRQTNQMPVTVAASSTPAESTGRSALAAVLFVPAQIVALGGITEYARHRTEQIFLALGVAALFGLALPGQASARRLAAAWPLLVALGMLVLEHRWNYGYFPFSARLAFLWLAAVQGAVAVGVHLLRNRNRGAESQA